MYRTDEKLRYILTSPTRKVILMDCSGSMEPLWYIAWKVLYYLVVNIPRVLNFVGFYYYSRYPYSEKYVVDRYGNAVIWDIFHYMLDKEIRGVLRKHYVTFYEDPPSCPITYRGDTPLFDAVWSVVKQFPDSSIILLTDGLENASTRTDLPSTDRIGVILLWRHSIDYRAKRYREVLITKYPTLIVEDIDNAIKKIRQLFQA